MSLEINGFCEERFSPLRDAFIANFDEGLEIGASLALTHRGKMVVDLWAGHADLDQTRPWEKDTIVNVMSTTKLMTATAFLMLIDRGLVELDTPVARYWPEFAAGGKEKVTVRDALSHQAGVPGLAQPMPWFAQRDWNVITSRIAAEPHWFGGQRRVCYHNNTYGYLLGEVMRRVDGRKPGQFFREEIAQKAGADFQIGLTSETDTARVAGIEMPKTRPTPSITDPETLRIAMRVASTFGPPYPSLSSWEFQSNENPAGSGFGNGRAIARVCAITAMGGELDGVRYLSKGIIEEAGREQAYGECPLMGWIKFGLGFGLHSQHFPAPTPTCMHWGGFGGSWALADPATGVSLGFVPNKFVIDAERGVAQPRLAAFAKALEALLPTL